MGMFAFRRMKEREAAAQVASIPVEAAKPKQKRKRKPKVTTDPPSSTNLLAAAAPIPEAPPEIIANFPLNLVIITP